MLFATFAVLCIPHWLTCFAPTAVTSAAVTELINRAEACTLLSCASSFALSLHTWWKKKHTWRKGGCNVGAGWWLKETEGQSCQAVSRHTQRCVWGEAGAALLSRVNAHSRFSPPWPAGSENYNTAKFNVSCCLGTSHVNIVHIEKDGGKHEAGNCKSTQ